MDKAQAVQEVIKLKKQYGTGGNDEAVNQQAETLRKQYGLDESRYGSGVSLADAYTNYYNEYGQSQNRTQQSSQIPQNQNVGFNQNEQLQNISDMYRNTSDSFLDEQVANFDRQLSNQISQLEQSYAQAVSEGKISIRDAEQAFNAQKGEIEKLAYQQSEANKLNANSLGIQNSQQRIGLQQGADARENTLHNTNMSERDKRIADIRDRITALQTQKNLAITNAENEYGYNVAGAQAQSNQMYNQSMSDLMNQNYFTQLGMQHDTNMMDRQHMYSKEMANFQNSLDINKMYVGKDIDIEKMEKEMATQLSNQLKIMEKDYGYKFSLSAEEQENAISRISAQASANAQAAIDAVDEARKLEAQKLGLDINATHNEIYEKQKQEANKAIITSSATEAYGQFLAQTKFGNPDLNLDPQKPKDYTSKQPLGRFDPIGNAFNLFTGYGGKQSNYEDETNRKTSAQKALDRYIKELGLPSMYGN